MRLKKIDINGFKSFGRQANIVFDTSITGIVGPNGSGKSNVVEAIRFALGEQSIKSMRGGQSTDFLFKSGSTSRGVARASVALTFDNVDRVFRLSSLGDGSLSLDTDEVVISREVYSDGSQKYAINGAVARMRDVVELISSVNIGSSGHHIISQGESDRFLFSSPKERRILLEEALGLKMYHYRIGETERKLEKSQVALREARILHKELEPHVKFLRKQVEKIQQAETLRHDIRAAYDAVLSPLVAMIRSWSANRQQCTSELTASLVSERMKLDESRAQLTTLRTQVSSRVEDELVLRLQSLRDAERMIVRDTSKYESGIEHYKRDLAKLEANIVRASEVRELQQVPLDRVRAVVSDLREALSGGVSLEAIIVRVQSIVDVFEATLVSRPDTTVLDQLRAESESLMVDMQNAQRLLVERESALSATLAEIARVEGEIRTAQQSELAGRAREFEIERQSNVLAQNVAHIESELAMVSRDHSDIVTWQFEYDSDLAEARAICGDDWQPSEYVIEHLERPSVDALLRTIAGHRRQLDRLKIRLEDMGVVSVDEVVREHDETEKRFTVLGTQITDIEHTIRELEPLLGRLQSEIRTNFVSGVERINKQFGEFFVTMFGGGHAEIVVIEAPTRRKKKESDGAEGDDEDAEQGVDIRVKIPNKKQGDLSILSGGERSLTSIALLFSLSQVNPPPFIVLDETDAALDEANSRRYGQLMKKLSSISQILVVTHNRETMGHCQRLYGVTLGADSASQLFSVKFEEAVQYAK